MGAPLGPCSRRCHLYKLLTSSFRCAPRRALSACQHRGRGQRIRATGNFFRNGSKPGCAAACRSNVTVLQTTGVPAEVDNCRVAEVSFGVPVQAKCDVIRISDIPARKPCLSAYGLLRKPLAPVDTRGSYQNLQPNFTPSTRGRSGTCDSMNCALDVNRLASELLKFVPKASTCHWSFAMPREAS